MSLTSDPSFWKVPWPQLRQSEYHTPQPWWWSMDGLLTQAVPNPSRRKCCLLRHRVLRITKAWSKQSHLGSCKSRTYPKVKGKITQRTKYESRVTIRMKAPPSISRLLSTLSIDSLFLHKLLWIAFLLLATWSPGQKCLPHRCYVLGIYWDLRQMWSLYSWSPESTKEAQHERLITNLLSYKREAQVSNVKVFFNRFQDLASAPGEEEPLFSKSTGSWLSYCTTSLPF